jgi:hypothetical protein
MSNGFNFSDIADETGSAPEDSYEDPRNYARRSAAQAVVDEAYSTETPSSHDGESIREKAVRQMEQANLYKLLLDNNIFQPNSAREDIQDLVEAEIKMFVEGRLAELLGLKTNEKAPVSEAFSDIEINALKAIAAKVVSKMPDGVKPTPNTPAPALNAVSAAVRPQSSPALNPVSAPKKTVPKKVAPATQPATKPAPAPKQDSKPLDLSGMSPEEAREEIRRRRELAGEAKPPKARKKLPMPTLEQEMQKYASEIQENSEAMSVAGLLGKIK